MPFAKVLRKLRAECCISQRALAERVSFTSGFIGMLETGERTPSVTQAVEIAVALDVDPYPLALEALLDRVVTSLVKELGPLPEALLTDLRHYLNGEFGEVLVSVVADSMRKSSCKSATM